jgi:hypothetical protein
MPVKFLEMMDVDVSGRVELRSDPRVLSLIKPGRGEVVVTLR